VVRRLFCDGLAEAVGMEGVAVGEDEVEGRGPLNEVQAGADAFIERIIFR